MIINYKGVRGALEVNQTCHDCSGCYTSLKCISGACLRVYGVVFPGVHEHMCDVWRPKDNLCQPLEGILFTFFKTDLSLA